MFGVQDILAVLFAAAALWYVVRFMRRAMSGKGGCHCDKGTPCNGVSNSGGSDKSGIRRVPLVSLSKTATREPREGEKRSRA